MGRVYVSNGVGSMCLYIMTKQCLLIQDFLPLAHFIDYLSISHIYIFILHSTLCSFKIFSNLCHIQTPVLKNSNNFLVF